MIRAVSFDYGGVLNHGGTAGVLRQRVCHSLGIKEDRFSEIQGEVAKLYRGKVSPTEFWTTCAQVLNITLLPDHLARWQELDVNELEPAFYEFAQRLKSEGLAVAILSNISALSVPTIRTMGGYDGFMPVLLSCEVGYAKPEPEFYQLLASRLKLEPNQIIHLDDQDYCLAGARAVGLQAIKVSSPSQAISQTLELITETKKATV